MLESSNKERLEAEISRLISFIAEGREEFFRLTGNRLDSSDDFLNHWISKETFAKSRALSQTDLNIQLLYIKLSSYYDLIGADKAETTKIPRNAFAHHSSDLIFNGRVQYNFFLHKVSLNFKKFAYIFYKENAGEELDDHQSKMIIFELDRDIRDFLDIYVKDQVGSVEQ